MGLADERRAFYRKREKAEIFVKGHAYLDYPERGFSLEEIVLLIRSGRGTVSLNNSGVAIEGSRIFETRDALDRYCKFVILIDVLGGLDCESQEGIQITVFSAFRE